MSLDHAPTRRRRRSHIRPPIPRVALTVGEFSWATGLSKPTLYRMMIEGELRFAQIGGTRRIPVTEFGRLGLNGEITTD
jgi:excisionase family DNA binding protein